VRGKNTQHLFLINNKHGNPKVDYEFKHPYHVRVYWSCPYDMDDLKGFEPSLPKQRLLPALISTWGEEIIC
jgi:hypothetical protein